MATFADMMSLLLTFFILLLSFAEMDIVKFRDAMGSINQALGFMPAGTGLMMHKADPIAMEKPMATSMARSDAKPTNEAIMEELEDLISKKGLEEDVEEFLADLKKINAAYRDNNQRGDDD